MKFCLVVSIVISSATSSYVDYNIDPVVADVVQRYIISNNRSTMFGVRDALRRDDRTCKLMHDAKTLGNFVHWNQQPFSELQRLKQFLDANYELECLSFRCSNVIGEARKYVEANGYTEIANVDSSVAAWQYTIVPRVHDRDRSTLIRHINAKHITYLDKLFQDGRYNGRQMIDMLEQYSRSKQIASCPPYAARQYLSKLRRIREDNIRMFPDYSEYIVNHIALMIKYGNTKDEIISTIYPYAKTFVTKTAFHSMVRHMIATQ